jgi:TrmH family RNA methyltransferase
VEALSKNRLKWIRSLQLKKNRDAEGMFVVEGEKMVLEVLQAPFAESVVEVVALKDYASLIPERLQGITKTASVQEMDQISALRTPNKLLAVVKSPQNTTPEQVRTIVLDGVQDPGNMGTILRLADWFGIKHLVCSKDTVDCFNSKVVQASMGAIFRVHVHYLDLEVYLKETTQPIYGALLNGKHYRDVAYAENGILIMGNEGKGIRPEILPLIQTAVTIPKFGEAESLNVATATAILLAEMVQ